MSTRNPVFSSDFTDTPYWWKDWRPHDPSMSELPREVDVAIVGAGYAGLSCALELAKQGLQVAVLEADVPGIGASTLSGGQVSGGVNVGKAPSGKKLDSSVSEERQRTLLTEASVSYEIFESILRDNDIECSYVKAGRINAMWTDAHMDAWRKRIVNLNTYARAGARILSREELRGELASDIYAGGVLLERAGQVHPSLMFAGLLAAARRAGVTVCSHAPVTSIARVGAQYGIETSRGALVARHVVICTNGYTGASMPDLQRRVVPVVSHQIATEELPADLQRSLIPRRRGISETRRVVNYYRYSPDGKRLMFGGRARFYNLDRRQSAAILHAQMVERFPQMADVKVAYSWGGTVALTLDFLPHLGRTADGLYYALGCNGSGVVMMTYLGYKVARLIVEGKAPETSAYGTPMVTHPLYSGKPWFMPALGSYYQIRDVIDKRKQHA
ncbi:MAG TPA: FAD-dependent oxidoreductase [Paraburkholderia sp.]|uniref:NAD(P)/FAD-dependent oxidoreductase n=1 Tax=Paraburkholderia sp. TaxID=1926495 RepID=UPI002ED47130